MVESKVELEFTGPFRELCKCRSSSLALESEMGLLALVRSLSSLFGDEFEKKLGLRDCEYDQESAIIILNGVVVKSSSLRSTVVKPGDRVVFAPSLASGG